MGEHRWVGIDGGEMDATQDGDPDSPALVLLTNAAAPTDIWDPVVPALAERHHVVRVNPLRRHPREYAVPAQARDVVALLDELGVRRATVVGHSSGSMVATALVEHRPALVAALALVDMSPDLTGKTPEPLASRLLLRRFPGALLWRLRTERTIRAAAASGFTRPVPVPGTLVRHMLALTHRDLTGTMGAYTAYLGERGLADRLAGTGVALLVVFGAEDQRWRAESAEGYRVVPGARIELLPGVGHMPMMEDPEPTARLLLEFAAVAGHPS